MRLIDSSLWVDFTRVRSPRSLKESIAPEIMAADACLAEPIMFEVLRYARDEELGPIESQFALIPLLATPPELWTLAAELGRTCRRNGVTSGGLDLLIAAVAIYHRAELVTFDADFQGIANVSTLRVRTLIR